MAIVHLLLEAEIVTMAKHIAKVTKATKESEGDKKRTGYKPTYAALSDEDKEFLVSVIAKRNTRAAQVVRAKIALLAKEQVPQ